METQNFCGKVVITALGDYENFSSLGIGARTS